MNRSLKLSMLLALALGSTQAAAVQLGQVQVKSALGQPLLAEIPVTPSSPAELASLTARLAAPEDFARAGITDGRPPMALQFRVASDGGHEVIRITSAEPVNDPYLDLLVEVSTRAGKSVREVTILLDPPGSVAAAPQRPAPAPSRTASRPAPAVAPTAPAARPAAANAGAPSVVDGKYGPVERGQTLSGIAQQAAPAGVDTNQMLLALKQANPDAFYRDNINALKAGVVLRVPTREDAQAMSVAAAMAEVRRQNGEWRNGPTSMPTTVADAATRPETSSAPASPAKADDRLALVPPGAGGSGAGRTADDKANSKVRQELLRSQESLTTLQQQSSELKSRLKDLEDINSKNARLLSLKDNEIAELQRKLADARKAADLPAAPVAAAAKPAPAATAGSRVETIGLKDTGIAAASSKGAAVATAGTSASVLPASAVSASSPQSGAAAAKPVPAKPVTKPARKSAPMPGEAPWYMQTWVWEAAGGAIVLLLFIALMARRRKPVAAAAASSSLADRFGAVSPAAPASEDPDQDELLDQLAEHPDDVGLHLELVSLYYSRRDIEHFEAAAEAMYAHVADPQQAEWLDVVAMGEDLVPGHPLFSGTEAPEQTKAPEGAFAEAHVDDAVNFGEVSNRFDEPAPAGESFGDFDLDRYAETDDGTPPAMPPLPTQKKVSEYHFDFNLTPSGPAPGTPASGGDDDAADDRWAEPAEDAGTQEPVASTSSWRFDEPGDSFSASSTLEGGGFSDDPIDTKLDLARAYLDMGDADGARAMLEEVMGEGSQMQKDAARGLLDSLH